MSSSWGPTLTGWHRVPHGEGAGNGADAVRCARVSPSVRLPVALILVALGGGLVLATEGAGVAQERGGDRGGARRVGLLVRAARGADVDPAVVTEAAVRRLRGRGAEVEVDLFSVARARRADGAVERQRIEGLVRAR